ncbi:LacI family DNA-binding transcriptional regulator [Flavimobilis sp. GY10621]|uniref:LacI family DNA-binding transcriptional regulator n=1 Tax=Flavimobilis rhizosphaerae TaxID=2775421 RepID=A0ABR9DQ81_9MICO|nr:LacI family DNA-binding transcriptional regulator [Flavimobilis rhizosphaerae]MBD9698487.1 LacI family DNA-binding transcriptional regulator [Flavimobilis rhizosphaerae]
MSVTIADVAREAGVSVSTVSYVLSGKRTISAPTRARVEAAVDRLGYRPHAGARALASARTNVIALMAPLRAGVDVGVIMQFVAGVVLRARHYDHDVLLLTQDDVRGAERVGAGSMVDAIVVMDVETHDERLEALARLRQPTVLIGLPEEPGTLSCVDLDFEAAGRAAVRHLTDLGHRRLGYVGHPGAVRERGTSFAVRFDRGVADAAQAAGASLVAQDCDGSPEQSVAAVEALFAADPRITGVVVHNEAALGHVVTHLVASGRPVPEAVSVVTVSPPEVAARQAVPVTGLDIPAERVAHVAVDMVLARVDGDEPAETRLLTPTLTDRGSTRPLG